MLLAGCSSLPQGPVRQPEIYPDRSDAELAWGTFLWAWRQGDLDVLLEVTGWRMHARLRKQIETNGEDAVAQYYRDGAEDLRVLESNWTTRGAEMGYLRVVFSSSSVSRVEAEFSFVERPDGWILTQQRTIR